MLDGFAAICVELGRDNPVEVPRLLASISSFAKSCIVRISGDTHDNQNDELYAFCSTLRDQGYLVAAEVRGIEKRPWADVVTYKIALISEDPWLMFAANEIRYAPSRAGKIPAPTLLQIHYASYCYLIPHRDNTGEEVFSFLHAHPGFRVLSSKTYRRSMALEEE
jgi:hypothetical protein